MVLRILNMCDIKKKRASPFRNKPYTVKTHFFALDVIMKLWTSQGD